MDKKKGQKLTKTETKEIEDDLKKYMAEFKELYEDAIKFLECRQKGASKREEAAREAKKEREKAKWMSTHPDQAYEPDQETIAKAKRFCQKDLSMTEEQLQEIEKMIVGRKYHRPQPRDVYTPDISMSKIVGYEIVNCGNTDQTAPNKGNPNGGNDTYAGYLIYTQIKDIKSFRIIRYSEFKNFDKEIKKIKPPEAVLPPPSSKFGKRNLSEEFIMERIEKLGAYLNEITTCNELNKTPLTQHFLTFPNSNKKQIVALDRAIQAMRRKHNLWCAAELSHTQEDSILKEIVKVISKERCLDPMVVTRGVMLAKGQAAVKELWEDLMSDKSMALKQTEDILSIEYPTYESNETVVKKCFSDLIIPVFEPLHEQLNAAICMFVHNLVPPAFEATNLGVDTLTTDLIRVINSAASAEIPSLLSRMKDIKSKYFDFLGHNILPEVTEIGQMLGRALTCDFFKENSILTIVGGDFSHFISEMFGLMDFDFWDEPIRSIFSFKESLSRIDETATTNIDSLINKALRDFKNLISKGEFHFCAEAKRVQWAFSRPKFSPGVAFVLDQLSTTVSDHIRNDFIIHSLMRFWNVFTDTAWGLFYDKSNDVAWSKKVDIAYEKGARAFIACIKKRFIGIIYNIVVNLFKFSIIDPLFNATFERAKDEAVADIIKKCIDPKTLAAFSVRSLFYSVLDNIITDYCSSCVLKTKDLIESSIYKLFSGIPPSTMSVMP